MNNYILGKLKSVFFFISTSHLPLLLKRLKLNLYVYPDVTSRFWRTIKFLAKKEPLLFYLGYYLPLMLGGIGGRRRRRQRMSWWDGITHSMGMSLSEPRSWWWTGRPGGLWFMGLQSVGHDWATELNWTELRDRETERTEGERKGFYSGNIYVLVFVFT